MYLANQSKTETISMINKIQSRYRGRLILLKRIESEEDFKINPPIKQTETIKNRLRFKDKVLQRKIDENLEPKDIRFTLQAIRMIPKENINLKYVLSLLKKWFQLYYTSKGRDSIATDLRYTICYLDRMLYRNKIKNL
jgi:hypothetical protein